MRLSHREHTIVISTGNHLPQLRDLFSELYPPQLVSGLGSVNPLVASQPIDLLFNAANNASASTAEGTLAEDSFKDLIVGIQNSVRAIPDDVFRQLISVVID